MVSLSPFFPITMMLLNILADEASTMPGREVNARSLSDHAAKSLFGSWMMTKSPYIGQFEITDNHRPGKIILNLTSRSNKCGVISS